MGLGAKAVSPRASVAAFDAIVYYSEAVVCRHTPGLSHGALRSDICGIVNPPKGTVDDAQAVVLARGAFAVQMGGHAPVPFGSRCEFSPVDRENHPHEYHRGKCVKMPPRVDLLTG